jgi:hypothetical protein
LRGWAKANVPFIFVIEILKFLRGGKVPIEGTELSCQDEAFKVAGISHVSPVEMLSLFALGLPITCFKSIKTKY